MSYDNLETFWTQKKQDYDNESQTFVDDCTNIIWNSWKSKIDKEPHQTVIYKCIYIPNSNLASLVQTSLTNRLSTYTTVSLDILPNDDPNCYIYGIKKNF